MPDLRFLLKVSRPRFWIYIFGPYLIGLVAAVSYKQELLDWRVMVFGLFFTFPANLLIYGVNDIFDYETDKLNPKKAGYEALVTPEKRRGLLIAIAAVNLPFFFIVPMVGVAAIVFFVIFLLLSIFYSSPPIRAKAIPFADSAFNILYIMPGLFAYSILSLQFPPAWVVVAGGLWTAAMHAFSAIPDIESDNKAGLLTIATELGRGWTHFFCAACYIIASFISLAAESPVGILGILYLAIIRYSDSTRATKSIFSIYRLFPYINAAVGFMIFWFVAIPKFLNW